MTFVRKTLFWFFVLIVLAGAFFFFDRKQETVRQSREAELKLLPFAAKDVSEFWIGGVRDSLRIRAVRQQDGWELTQPVRSRGDARAIERFLTNIVSARKDAVLFAHAESSKLAELGFDSQQIEMGLKSGGEETVIIFGGRGPTNNIAYIMFAGKPEVYRVHSDLKKEVARDAYAFRDKTILEFDPLRMKRLEIVKKGAPRTVIEHHQGNWTMLEPTGGRASMAKVLELLYAVRNGEVKTFTDENPNVLSAYGLSSPMLQLTIFVEQVETPYTLAIGDKDRPSRAYHARTNLLNRVFGVDEELVNTILATMEKLPETASGG